MLTLKRSYRRSSAFIAGKSICCSSPRWTQILADANPQAFSSVFIGGPSLCCSSRRWTQILADANPQSFYRRFSAFIGGPSIPVLAADGHRFSPIVTPKVYRRFFRSSAKIGSSSGADNLRDRVSRRRSKSADCNRLQTAAPRMNARVLPFQVAEHE